MVCSYNHFVLLYNDADARVTLYDVEPLQPVGCIRELGLFNPINHPTIESIAPPFQLREEPTRLTHPPSASYFVPSTQVATVTLLQIQLTR